MPSLLSLCPLPPVPVPSLPCCNICRPCNCLLRLCAPSLLLQFASMRSDFEKQVQQLKAVQSNMADFTNTVREELVSGAFAALLCWLLYLFFHEFLVMAWLEYVMAGFSSSRSTWMSPCCACLLT